MMTKKYPLRQHNVAHNVDYGATVQHCMGNVLNVYELIFHDCNKNRKLRRTYRILRAVCDLQDRIIRTY